MAGSILVASLAVVAGILLFLYWKLSSEADSSARYPLQVIVFAFLLGIIVLLGKVGYDYKDNCAWLVNSSTVVGSTTNYAYTYNCSTNTNNTANVFYDVTLWIARIITIYVFLTFAFEVINFFAWRKKGGGR